MIAARGFRLEVEGQLPHGFPQFGSQVVSTEASRDWNQLEPMDDVQTLNLIPLPLEN